MKYPTYRLTRDPGKRPHGLADHLGEYDIPGTLTTYDRYSDGSARGYWFSVLGQATYGWPGAVYGAAVALVGAIAGRMVEAAKWWARADGSDKAEPQALEAVADVRLLVSPMRARFAELTLLKWATREGWTVEPGPEGWVEIANVAAAKADPTAPTPWKRQQGYGTGRDWRAPYPRRQA